MSKKSIEELLEELKHDSDWLDDESQRNAIVEGFKFTLMEN